MHGQFCNVCHQGRVGLYSLFIWEQSICVQRNESVQFIYMVYISRLGLQNYVQHKKKEAQLGH